MTIYSDPPALRVFYQDKPTLLVCWWATSFSALMIIIRVAGRFIRTEKLFIEDRIAALALVPLFLRMVCVHFVLKFGTNNADFSSVTLSADELHQKSVASGLVLLSRFFYAATLWTLKCSVLEFLKRLTDLTWQKAHHTALTVIRWALLVTFIGVVISNLAECHPFNHYWQVLPSPPGQCRQGFVQLITMATCDILTDLMLVVFPVSIIIASNMSLRRKLQLVMLFSLSLSVVIVTTYRLPRILGLHGRQQYRSLLASVEIIFATIAANALVLGSFVRDRGVKKKKFHRNSAADSFDRSSNTRRPTLHRQWGSDEDLVRDVGLNIEPDLLEEPETPDIEQFTAATQVPQKIESSDWRAPSRDPMSHRSDESLDVDPLTQPEAYSGRKGMSFLDVGGLLEESAPGGSGSSHRRSSHTSSTIDANPPGLVPPPSKPASNTGVQRGSTALLQDLGGVLGPRNTKVGKGKSRGGTELQSIPQAQTSRPSPSRGGASLELKDPGGLLK